MQRTGFSSEDEQSAGPKIGQSGELTYSVCCNALRLEGNFEDRNTGLQHLVWLRSLDNAECMRHSRSIYESLQDGRMGSAPAL